MPAVAEFAPPLLQLTADITQLVRVADDPQNTDDAAFDRTDVDSVDVAGDLDRNAHLNEGSRGMNE